MASPGDLAGDERPPGQTLAWDNDAIPFERLGGGSPRRVERKLGPKGVFRGLAVNENKPTWRQ